LQVSYTSEYVVEGKKAAKEALQQRLGLRKADLPLLGVISRLTHQKGIHLIKHAISRTLERGGQVFNLFFIKLCVYITIYTHCSHNSIYGHYYRTKYNLSI